MENKNVVQIMYHGDDLERCEAHGNFIDLRAAETVEFAPNSYELVSLGVSMKLPEGYWGQLVPRSSLFKNHKVILANSFGVIDNSYSGDGDVWKACLVNLSGEVQTIEKNERICQFRIVKDNPITLKEVDHLDGPDRGGFGSTGK